MVFEPSASRQVPVAPAVEGRPAPGYVIGKVSSDPETVEVVGPESAVKRVSEAMTEPVSVAGARDPVHESVTVGFLDPALRLKAPRAASVVVDVVPAPLERLMRSLPVHLRNLAPALSAEAVPSAVDVNLRGSREALGRVAPDDVVAYVDLAGLGAGQYSLTVHADASRETGVTRTEPATVQVRVSRVKN
jgi:YbbR domain-containing protein